MWTVAVAERWRGGTLTGSSGLVCPKEKRKRGLLDAAWGPDRTRDRISRPLPTSQHARALRPNNREWGGTYRGRNRLFSGALPPEIPLSKQIGDDERCGRCWRTCIYVQTSSLSGPRSEEGMLYGSAPPRPLYVPPYAQHHVAGPFLLHLFAFSKQKKHCRKVCATLLPSQHLFH